MRPRHFSLFLLFAFYLVSLKTHSQDTIFDFGWRFHRGGAKGAEMPHFDDSNWQNVDIPHDWSLDDLPGTDSPFDPDAVGQVSSGFTTYGTGWYRKKFTVPAGVESKKVIIQFDGVYMNADVWLNGNHLGSHPYGYTGFYFDLTDHLNFDSENVLAVQVKNEGQTSRWYSGSGIYRHVWLKILDPVHFTPWGIFITTPEVSTSSAVVNIRSTVRNDSESTREVRLVTRIVDSRGREKARIESEQNLQGDMTLTFDQDINIDSPGLWSTNEPVLYTAKSEIFINEQMADALITPFGIRSIAFSPEDGFLLNGEALELKGGCVHHDNGPLGARAYDRAEERKVELLKASGYNAIRIAHNPPSPAFLDACDRLGMLVIDEAFDMWNLPNNPHDYHLYFKEWWQRDLRSMILRDRNHPSIIMWSIGNEIDGMETKEVIDIAHDLAGHVRSLDPTRPVTAAVNRVNPGKDPFFSALDINGYNYAFDQYVPDHERVPERIMYSSESFPLEAYDYWMAAEQHPWVIGDFVWTAFDYIGEASIGWRGYMQESNFYPWNLAYCGDIDVCGWKRPQSYYRDALWNNGNAVSIFVQSPEPSFPPNPDREPWSKWHWQDVVADWNWPGYRGELLDVVVYSSCDKVELFLNGKSLGVKETGKARGYMATWKVAYQPGSLKAAGFKGTEKITESRLVTAGAPASIRLSADRVKIKADGQDLSYVTVELLDEEGIRNPKAENLVRFEINGPATIEATGNANPVSLESYKLPQRKAWKGRCMVILKSGREKGKVILKAISEGMEIKEIAIEIVD